MAAVRFREPASRRTRPDRTGSLLKDNRTHRLDALHSDVRHARRDVHRADPEDDRSGKKHRRRSGDIPRRRTAVHRCRSFNGARCSGCLQLLKEAVWKEQCRSGGIILA